MKLSPDHSPEDLKSAWRQAVRDHHPDLHPDDPTAEDRFKRYSEAYEVLTGVREADEPSSSSKSKGPSGVNLSSIFEALLNQAAKPVHKATLVDLLGDDAATSIQAGARAFLSARDRGAK